MTDGPEAVGVLGGTFDPVHLGHLTIAQEVQRRLGLRRMLLIPTAVPPHKTIEELSPAEHREAMLRLAIRGCEGLELCDLELRRDRASYTIDTLRALRRGPPPLLPLFVLGADALLQIHSWRGYREILRDFDLVVVDRPDLELERPNPRLQRGIAERIVAWPSGRDGHDRRAARDPGRGGRIFHLPLAPIAISSSTIRRRAAERRSLIGLVPPAVAEYIQSTGLYRQESAH